MSQDEQLITRVVGDTLTPISVVLFDASDNPVSLTGKTVTFKMVGDDTWVVYPESDSHVSKEVVQTFVATSGSRFLNIVGHKLRQGQQVVLTTTGTLPAGLATGTRYFVTVGKTNFITLSLMPDGEPIAPTSAGSGTHSLAVVGQCQWAPQASAVDTAGDYFACFRVASGGDVDTFPGDQVRLRIRLEERP